MAEEVSDIKAVMEQMSGVVGTIKDSADAMKNVSSSVDAWHQGMESIAAVMKELMGFQNQAVQQQEALKIGGTARNIQLSMETELQREHLEIMGKEAEAADAFTVKLERWYQIRRDQLNLEHEHLASAYKNSEAVSKALTNVEGIGSSVMSKLPFGGFLGFLLMGAKAGAQWEADTMKVTQQFDVVGGKAGEFAGRIQEYIKNFGATGVASAEEISSIGAAFAEAGITAKEVFGDGAHNILAEMGLDHKDLMESTLAMDKLMEVSAGTFAKLTGSAVGELGNTLAEATDSIVTYGMAAQTAHMNTMSFLSGVMQSSQQLKLYHIQLSDVANMTLQVAAANTNKHMDPRFAGTIAQAGIGQMVQGVGNMPDGLAVNISQAVMAELASRHKDRILRDTNGQPMAMDPISTLMEFRHGGRDINAKDQKDFFPLAVQALGQMAELAGHHNKGTAEFFLQKNGMGAEGARAIAEIYFNKTSHNRPLSPDEQKAIRHALDDEEKKTSGIERAMKELKTAVAEVSNGLLGMIVDGIKIIIQSLQMMVEYAEHPGDFKKNSIMARNYQESLNEFAGNFQLMGEGVTRAGEAGMTGLTTINFKNLDLTADRDAGERDRHQRIQQDFVDRVRAREADAFKDALRANESSWLKQDAVIAAVGSGGHFHDMAPVIMKILGPAVGKKVLDAAEQRMKKETEAIGKRVHIESPDADPDAATVTIVWHKKDVNKAAGGGVQ